MKHLTLKICGKVQGVFFRKNTKKVADMLGVVGWVMNEVDRSVLVEAEGDDEKLKKLLEWAKKGPQGSSVEKVEESWSDDIFGYSDFEIKWNDKIIG
jgi:acylphosphatase